ncbi:MAG: TonB-dependent receptor domain-containing protein, partial [Terriglobia bacterium]
MPAGIPAQFGIQGISQANGNYGLPNLGISGLTSLGAGEFASPNIRYSNTWQLSENLTKVYGKHTFKGGFEAQFLRFPWSDPTTSRGVFSFGTYAGIPNVTGGSGMADLLLTPIASTVPGGINNVGGPSGVTASNISSIDDLRHYYGAYFQDDYKVTPKVTLNLGLRWEFFGQINEKYGANALFEPGTYSGLNTVQNAAYVINARLKNQPLSPSFTSLLAKDGIALEYSSVPGLMNTPLTDFSPRTGLAWQATKNLVVRLGYGIFFGGFQSIGGAPDPGFNYPNAVTLSNPPTDPAHPITFANGQNATLERGLLDMEPFPSSPGFRAQGLGLTAFQNPW